MNTAQKYAAAHGRPSPASLVGAILREEKEAASMLTVDQLVDRLRVRHFGGVWTDDAMRQKIKRCLRSAAYRTYRS